MTRQDEFKGKLFALLREYDVEMKAEEGWCGYATTVEGISFWSDAKYNSDGDKIRDTIDFMVGQWEDGKTAVPELVVPADDLVYRLRKRAEIRRQIPTRKSVQNGETDRLADLLDEAASALEAKI